ncbi:MAG: haloacid dehalogenase-like hydrolase [Myxococcaceae bacterium]
MSLSPDVEALLTKVCGAAAGRNVVFDADGTLWRGDVGEDFLRFAFHRRLFPGEYADYERHLARSASHAYGWAVEIMRGLDEATLQRTCDEFFEQRFKGRVFGFVRPVLARLRAAGATVWICSASPRWAVLPGARALGIAPEHVIGVSCAVTEGALTGQLDAPVPVGPGKVTWLERRAVKPLLAVGNGDFDLDMLAAAELALVIAPPDSDNQLVAEARARRWPILRA